MRVVAGIARGRRLVAPAGTAVRPTSDRVREAVFNALGSLDAVEGAAVLDLFAGSGALGIEALSRGAASATFVDRDRAALAAVRANLAACRLAERAEVVAAPADRFLDEAAGAARQWDLALLDPPYEHPAGGWLELLERVPAALLVVESPSGVALTGDWEELRRRRYGRTTVQFALRRKGEPAGPRR